MRQILLLPIVVTLFLLVLIGRGFGSLWAFVWIGLVSGFEDTIKRVEGWDDAPTKREV